MNRLQGKVAFITGTSSGQGRTAARIFAAEGAFVVGCWRQDADGGRETERMVREAGGRMISSQVDMTDRAAAQAWINDGVAEAGGLDILYNNAAGARYKRFAEMSPESWTYTLVNELDIVFHASQAAWPHLIARGGGAILNTASTVGLRGRARMGAAGHATGKAGLMGLTRQMAAEGAQHQIRVNAISPGVIATPALARSPSAFMDQVIAEIPLGRAGQPEDVAYCALWLASDEGAWITAQNFVIDGGSSEIK
ncbi:SDR family NAD(P)-dependent oxidoreductase [Phenylobacterium sp.]|jgi:NAD(P)-dependent dehydrogenase (short-subunit alcohol dehydrogenase family)|uniref:SDR family NAD(P)-dependent oxidoreductase n=1 Tax=Phenylobacterium sp. TaxID=1871053 RepID=UPI002F3F89FD